MTASNNSNNANNSVFEYGSVESSLNDVTTEDGIHRIKQNNCSLDILLQGIKHLAENTERVALVCFNGAVSDRKDKFGPFFSGRGVAQALGMPLLSIDDPSLSRSDELGLAWYAGHAEMPALIDLIADYLNRFATKMNCRLVVFGGSGGGFASISVLSKLRIEATALVWNPQTNISRYRSDAVASYLATAFPEISLHSEDQSNMDFSQEALADALTRAGVRYDITNWVAPDKAQLLYLQNSSDWHVKAHAQPFMTNGSWERIGKRSFYCQDRGVACWFGVWGEGHAAPPLSLIHSALSKLINGISVSAAAAELDADNNPTAEELSWFKVDGPPGKIRISAKRNQDFVKVHTTFEEIENPRTAYEYAYYLYRNGERLAVHWYDESPEACIACPAGIGAETIQVFVRDSFGTAVIANAAVFDDKE